MSATNPPEATMTEPATGTKLPLAPGVWTIDPNHSGVHFKVRHIGLTNVRGRFNKFDATLTVGETLEETHVEATIDMTSVDTNQPDRDAHLRSTDFFSADEKPTMEFRSTGVRDVGEGEYELDGDLTINGITKQVTLPVEFSGLEALPGGGSTHAGFATTLEVNRDDYGVDFNMPLGLDNFALGKKINVEIDIQFAAPQS
jgi:polyisoprenoid-binding protein YceI